mmetsp:Transcript_147004/g.256665  ORF Transcript_147004/g.256665 Transcript_147004/m.256665 type:complete len:95 (-) Transcript_147004:8-292(-)
MECEAGNPQLSIVRLVAAAMVKNGSVVGDIHFPVTLSVGLPVIDLEQDLSMKLSYLHLYLVLGLCGSLGHLCSHKYPSLPRGMLGNTHPTKAAR